MNYDAFMEPVTWFLTGMEKHSDEARPDSYGNPDYFLVPCIIIWQEWADRVLQYL